MDDARFSDSLHPPEDPLLLELEQRGRAEGVPMIGRSLGRLLSVLVHGMQANRILEIGTGYGYATLWMALAQPPAGKIWTIDVDRRRTDVALSYFRRAGEDDSIEVLNQPAIELLENFPHRNLDIVVFDTDPADYAAFLDLIVPMLKLSGLVIVHGCLADEQAARSFAHLFVRHPDLDATILPIGAGTGIGARVQ
jgi:predicted O-methyltransferase YrrM